MTQIGQHSEFVSSSGAAGFDEKGRHRRTREIGFTLHERGGEKLMAAAYYRVCHQIGARRDLEYAWNGIGDWQA